MEKVLAKMELQGVKVDVSRIMEYKKELENEEKTYLEKLDTMCDSHIRRIENDLYEQALSLRKTEAGKKRVEVGSEKYGTQFNWGSNQHIGKILYEGLSVPAQYKKKTKSGQWDTSEAQLCEIERVSNGETKTFLQDFAKYKKVQKLLSTYTGDDKGLLGHVENGRIYPSFIQGGGPVTGRLACREPNLQNLPRGYPQIKRFFVPDAGRIFCYFDYSQVELRIAAHLSNDPVMLRGFNEGHDLHAATAKRIFGSEITKEQRQVGKQINFATIYDASAYRLEALFEGRYTVEECEAFRKGFFNLYCGYSRYLENTKQSLIRDGYTVSHFGRVRRLPELKEYPKNSKEFKHAIKQGLNFNIQSFAASICKRTMIALYNERYELVTQVHDSVIISLAIDSDLGYNIKRIQEIAENIVTLKVPLKAEVKLLNSFDEGDEYANGHSKTG
jgi:DNA polymerase-1